MDKAFENLKNKIKEKEGCPENAYSIQLSRFDWAFILQFLERENESNE